MAAVAVKSLVMHRPSRRGRLLLRPDSSDWRFVGPLNDDAMNQSRGMQGQQFFARLQAEFTSVTAKPIGTNPWKAAYSGRPT